MHISRCARELAYKAREIIEEKTNYKTLRISERDGFTIFMVENDKRIIVWVRSSPITPKAINLFNKIIGKYEYDHVIIFRTDDTPNHIKIPKEYTIVYSIEKLVETILTKTSR